MSSDNPTKVLTAHDLSSLRTVQRVLTTSAVDNSNNSIINAHNTSSGSGGNLVFSTIPLDALLIQHSLPSADVTVGGSLNPQQAQQQRSNVPGANGLRLANVAATTLNSHNNNNNSNHINSNNNHTLNSLLAKAATSKISKISSTPNGNMSGTSKYVLLQQNSNGQFTTFEGTTATGGNGAGGNGSSAANVGNIVLLAAEPMELNGSVTVGGEQARIITTGGDNDEELRPLAWLNDINLIKGIVTTTTAGSAITTNSITGGLVTNGGGNTGSVGINLKRANGNICIVNASNAHELIEELPQHVVSEEHVTTAANNHSNNTGSTQAELHTGSPKLTALNVSDLQQFKRYESIIAAGTPITLVQQDGTTVAARKDDQHIFGNIAAIGATTTVHVGPSGTTTVVEYKSNSNFVSTQRQLFSSAGNAAAAGSNASVAANTSGITATNLSSNNNNPNSNYVPSSASASNSAASSHNQTLASASASNSTSSSIAVSLTAPNAASSAAPSYTSTSTATLSIPKQLSLPGGIVNASNSTNVTVVNGNSTTNTIYQGQQKPAHGNNSTSTANNNNVSTTHHPNKKYLREKMNVTLQDHGGGSANGGEAGGGVVGISNSNVGSAITIVASPASSNNSVCSGATNGSSATSSSSTAAVNGGNSPISKTFYNNSTNNSSTNNVTFVGTTSPATSIASPNTSAMPTYTIMQYSNVSSSPAMSSPEPVNSKEYFTTTTSQQLQQQQRNNMRSPTSYSSYDNDSLRDFDVSNASSSTNVARSSVNASQQQSSKSGSNHSGSSGTPQKQKHPNNVPYDPYVHTHSKPPYSFSSLIFMAIEGSNEKALPVKEIYAWIVQHFPYFKTAPTGWKNSVRHNLSLNKSFVKVEKAPNMGKGSLWRVEPLQRPNLIQALSRSPFFPTSAVDKIVVKSPGGGASSTADSVSGYDTIDSGGANSPAIKGSTSQINPRIDPRLFPKLAKAIKDIDEHVILNDPADDEIPSDYSTRKHTSHNTTTDYLNIIKNSSNNRPYSPVQNGNGSLNPDAGSGTSIMGAFSNYENIERLARDCGADSIDDVNAATAMLALKHGPKVFAEKFKNGAPVITSSPSEDHTYSAGGGGSTAGSGNSTPLINGNSGLNSNGILGAGNGPQNGCGNGDNQSNCASSDAAYESSEESHNITPEELEDQQRHRDGVDALLSLSLSSVVDVSNGRSPTKRSSLQSVEEEHVASCMENSQSLSNGIPPIQQDQPHIGKMAVLNSGASYSATQQQQQHLQHQLSQLHNAAFDEVSYSAASYYGTSTNQHQLHPQNQQHTQHHLIATTANVKKVKPLRNLRTKIKRKTWIR